MSGPEYYEARARPCLFSFFFWWKVVFLAMFLR
jgi:hypothetical protein